MNVQPLDHIPLWCVLPLLIAIGTLFMEWGYRFGRWRHARAAEEKEAPVASMVASVLGLLAFMLAFTFSMAAARFDARRQAVLHEANAIGTTYLRTRLLPEPQRHEIAALLRRYTEVRSQVANPANIRSVLTESENLHAQLWSQATAVAEKDPHSMMTGLFIQSLNQAIDLHAERVFVGMYSRIPSTLWLALFSLTLLGLASIGYQAGLSETRRSPEMPILTLAFAGVLYLIVDLDRAHEGLLHVSQQAILDLLRTMENIPPDIATKATS
jgi:hypothetical protein